MSLLVTPDCEPAPSADILQRLGQIPDRDGTRGRVGLRWSEPVKTFAITIQWSEHDPRREMIQKGHAAATSDWDIICFLPSDCPLEQAYGYLVNGVKSYAASNKDEVRALVAHVHEFNAAQSERNAAPMVDLVGELARAQKPKTYQSQGDPGSGKRKRVVISDRDTE